MSFYSDMAATATALLTEFGKTITLTRSSGDSYNPLTGETVTGPDTSVTTNGLLRPYQDKVIDGTRILSGDRELILSSEQQPLKDDRPVIGGEEWHIVNIKTIKPDDATPLIYFCQVRP